MARLHNEQPEKPLGVIDMHFCRAELHDPNAKGNLCHWHCVFWTKDNLTTKEGLHVVLDRICGFISDIVRPDERKQLTKEGIFKDEHDVMCFLDTMQTFLQHKHLRRCYAMVKNGDSETEEQKLMCKVSNNYRMNPAQPGTHLSPSKLSTARRQYLFSRHWVWQSRQPSV